MSYRLHRVRNRTEQTTTNAFTERGTPQNNQTWTIQCYAGYTEYELRGIEKECDNIARPGLGTCYYVDVLTRPRQCTKRRENVFTYTPRVRCRPGCIEQSRKRKRSSSSEDYGSSGGSGQTHICGKPTRRKTSRRENGEKNGNSGMIKTRIGETSRKKLEEYRCGKRDSGFRAQSDLHRGHEKFGPRVFYRIAKQTDGAIGCFRYRLQSSARRNID